MQINWKQKMTSRKFWAYVSGFVTSLLIFYTSEELSKQIGAIILLLGDIIAYLYAETTVDVARTKGEQDNGTTSYSDEETEGQDCV